MKKKGFTLIEIMLVVIIIGVLVAMVMPRLAGRSQEARTAAAQADIFSNISTALDLYELDNGKYPESLDVLLSKTENGKGPYLKRSPVDPWKKPYKYKTLDNGQDYQLWSSGADGQDGGSDDIKSWETQSSEE